MSSLKVGLIGAGVFGGYHAGKVSGSDKTLFSGLFDPDQARAKDLAEQHGTQAFDSAEALYDASDAIIVACPATWHETHVAKALDAGCHVLVEKPLALSGAPAAELAQTADTKGLVLQVGHQERLVLRAMGFFHIDETPLTLEAVREGPPAPDGRAGDVSVIWDLMIHDLDMASKLMGAESSVFGAGRKRHTSHIDEAEAEIEFEWGASAVIKASRAAPERRRRMSLTYPSGTITIDYLERSVENSTPFPIRGDISEILPDPLGAADEAFFAACLGNGETPIPGREAARAVRLAEKVEQTALDKIGA